MRHFLFLLATLAWLPVSAQTFDAGDWPHKSKVAIDTTPTGAEIKEGLARLPLALRLHTGNFAFAEAKPDGSDLRVTAADGKTLLPFQIESYDAANELAVIWVQLPKLVPNFRGDAFTLHWGNPKSTAPDNSRGAYDASQIFVLHFSEKDQPRDASGNANHPRESSARLGAIGPLAGAATFDGESRLVIPASPSLKLTAGGGFTFTAWLKAADAGSGRLLAIGSGPSALSIDLVSGQPVVSQGKEKATATAALKPGTWQHLAVTAGGGRVNFFIDGKDVGGGNLLLGEVAAEAIVGQKYRGDFDEVTLAGLGRPADYIKALYESQQPDGKLLSIGEPGGEGSGGSTSYMNILLGAVTIDGWIVIAILVVMFFISVAVMAGKTRFLLRARRANTIFMERFKAQSVQLLSPDTPESAALANESAVVHSPIYRLYAIGLREIKHRIDAQAGSGRDLTLSAAALDAIRASMDGGMVRESQRLNSQIVLLTIAISGGPFLGLLGTVVGVMITFAAIAAAGDVNVNSIAPGIAAALVATVAGLGVAIPALFGYNWLASQIKEVTADTHVFSDEFLTKAAELYSR
jgi:biopolymer transport protein ExbB